MRNSKKGEKEAMTERARFNKQKINEKHSYQMNKNGF